MRTAFVTHYSKLYGANRSLLCLLEGLKPYGVQPYVLAPKQGPITVELSRRNIPFYTIPFKRWMTKNPWKAPLRLGMNLGVLPLLVHKLRQWDVDLIHTNSSVTPIGALLAELLQLPHTWHVREFGKRDFDLLYDWGKLPFEKLISRADSTIAVSNAVYDRVLKDIDVSCHVVYNGVISKTEITAFSNNDEKCGGGAPPYTFSIVGRISPAKGQMQALRAFYRLRQQGAEARLLVAGSGNKKHEDSLFRLRQSLGLEESVSFLGYISDPFDVYQRADAVLVCSPHEAMGRVTAEAMAAGRPVIGYDNDGTAELIYDGQNGLLYNGTTEHLSHCMRRFISNPDWAHSLGQNGRETARCHYTNEVYAKRIYEVLSGVLATKG